MYNIPILVLIDPGIYNRLGLGKAEYFGFISFIKK